MQLSLKRWSIGVVLGVFFLLLISTVHAGSPNCGSVTPNTNPIARIGIIEYGSRDNPPKREAPVEIGKTVILDATPKDSSNKPTTGKGEPTWNVPPEAKITGWVGKANCFVPKITGVSDGRITVTVTQDGITSDPFELTVGKGGVGSGDSESDKVCCYKNTNGTYSMAPNSRGLDCNDVPFCVQLSQDVPTNKCEVKQQDECIDGGIPAGKTGIIIQIPPQELPSDLGGLITNIFNWSLALVGISVFVMILYGGATWLVAAGSPALVGKARGIITNALLGAVLLLSSYLILNTINPDFVKQSTTLPAVPDAKSSNQTYSSGIIGSQCISNTSCKNQLLCGPNNICQQKVPKVFDACLTDANCNTSGGQKCDKNRVLIVDNQLRGTCTL